MQVRCALESGHFSVWSLHQKCLLLQFCHWLLFPSGGEISVHLGSLVTRPAWAGMRAELQDGVELA